MKDVEQQRRVHLPGIACWCIPIGVLQECMEHGVRVYRIWHRDTGDLSPVAIAAGGGAA